MSERSMVVAGKSRKEKKSSEERKDVYGIVTERLINELEVGTVPWKRPWLVVKPYNVVSKREYRGLNALMLSMMPHQDPRWLSFMQALSMGGNVRKGEKGSPVVFYQMIERRLAVSNGDEGEGQVEVFPVLRYSTIFNVEQCEGLKNLPVLKEKQGNHNPIEACERLVLAMPKRPDILHGSQAYYAPVGDYIRMPKPERFESRASYYGTLFHEMVHATGHASRLGREPVASAKVSFGSGEYSKEELVAEIGACFLCAEVGIFPEKPENEAAYLSSWLKVLRGDRRVIVNAASQAQKASDYILRRDEIAGDSGTCRIEESPVPW